MEDVLTGVASLRDAMNPRTTEVTFTSAGSRVNAGLALASMAEQADDGDALVRQTCDLGYSPMFWLVVADYQQGRAKHGDSTEMQEFLLREFAARMFLAGVMSEQGGKR